MMGKSSPFQDETGLKKGPWTPEEDQKLIDHVNQHGHGSWRALPKLAGLNRCGKSCRLRWTNYLRPDIKRGKFSDEEEQVIINLHAVLGNKWSAMAQHLPGRTDNEIKNFWNTHVKKKLLQMGIDPVTHRPRTDHLNILAHLPQLLAAANFNNLMNVPWSNNVNINNNGLMSRLQNDATLFAKLQILQNILQVLSSNGNSITNLEAPNNIINFPPSSLPHDIDHDHGLLYEYLRAQVQGQSGNNFGQQNATHFDPNFPMDNKVAVESKPNNFDSSSSSSSYGVLPQLVSVSSPKTCPIENNKISESDHDHPIATNYSNISPNNSTTFGEEWGDLMDDEASDSYWREIIEQASTQPWPNSL